MADNVSITPGTGVTISTEDVGGGVEIQRVKLATGAHGSDGGDVTSGNPLPVVDSSGNLAAAKTDLDTLAGTVASGKVKVTPDSVALPAHQSVNLDEIGGSTLTIGQQLTAASIPVCLPAAQITAISSGGGGGATNYSLETGGNLATLAGAVSSSKVQTNVAQVNGQTPALNAGISGAGTLRTVPASANVLNITQVSVPTTAGGISVIAANPNRMRVRVITTSTNPVWISTNSTPTAANGAYIPGIAGYPWVSRFEGALYAISTGGTALVTVDEEASA